MIASPAQWTAAAFFALAILHTFSAPLFARLAQRGGRHGGVWHLLSEPEVVFGVWAGALIGALAALEGGAAAVRYMDGRNFTEPLFVFTIMVVAASRPVLEMVGRLVRGVARCLPMPASMATFFVVMALVPLSGSFVTEPAAMTLAAMLLRDSYFRRAGDVRFKYMALGVLFVNVSIGGVLTSYAAPPVLMVADAFGWDSAHMFMQFGWRAMIAVVINAGVLTFCCRAALRVQASEDKAGLHKGAHAEAHGGARLDARPPVPPIVMAIHTLFLIGVVLAAHHPAIFLGLLMLFIGYTEAYKQHQSRLMIREGLMVGFFLAGLVVLGGMQQWWLQDVLGGLSPTALFWGATALTAIVDNAALTYLGSLVQGTSDVWRTMLVAGAVTGGGLTVIANAPNPAGFALLKRYFPDESIAAGPLFLAALAPTLVAAALFLWPI